MQSYLLTINGLLARKVESIPEKEAIVDGEYRWTFSQLSRQVDIVAKALISLGVMHEDRVAMLAPPGKEFFQTYLATTAIGAIWTGINPKYKSRDFEHLLKDAKPKVVITFSPFDGRNFETELMEFVHPDTKVVTIGDVSDTAMQWNDFLILERNTSPETLKERKDSVSPEDAAVIVYTSGTTGQPKGAVLSHRAISMSAQLNVEWMASGLEKALCPAPINHVGCLNNICMPVFEAGGTIIFFPRVDAVALAQIAFQERPPYMVTSPTGFNMMLEAPGFAVKLISYTKLIVYGGATTPQSTLEKFLPLNAKMASVYGQTETCGIVTRTKFDAPLEVKANTIGSAIPMMEIRIADEHEKQLGIGQAGEIQVKGPVVMSGYYNKPEETEASFTHDGFLKTGDIAILREDGNYQFVGRIKEMFKSGGYNIYPAEIEQAICEHPDVLSSAVVSVEDIKFQEVGYAFVSPPPGKTVSVDDLVTFLKSRIANYKVPKTVAILDTMPLLPNGKIDKRKLEKKARDRQLS